MDILNTKIKNILTEKNTKISPENIKKDVTVLGITGTYEGQQPTLQNKSVTITENGTTTITPDSGYDGLDEVEVTANVSGGIEGSYAKLDYSGMTSASLSYAIRELSDIDFSSQTSCSNAFAMPNLEKIGEIKNTSKVTNMNSMFTGCTKLAKLDSSNFGSSFDTSNVVNGMNYMFQYGTGFVELDLSNFNTKKVTYMMYMFGGCTNLTTIIFGSNFTLEKCTNASSLQQIFGNCPKLNNNTLNEILRICTTYGGSSNKTLKFIGLTSAQATTCTGLSNYQAFLDAGWTTGY